MRAIPLGPEGTALFKVRDATGKERTVNIPRRASYNALLPQTQRPDATPVRKLDGNTAYIDVERVGDALLDSALAELSKTRAMILDLRGAAVAPRAATRLIRQLATQPNYVLTREIRRYTVTPCPEFTVRQALTRCPDARLEQLTWETADTVGHYRGRVLVLIDERTQGAAERLALALESATTVTFVGSQSAGAASIPVPLELPGSLAVGIPVVEVRRADGGQLQRVGITPTVDVRPTLRGIRNRDDEVLQRAQQWIALQLDAPVRRKR
jgi:C-terminal processing protease CtpA/Prc